MYALLKSAHVILAYATIAGFVLRGYWMATGSSLLDRKVTRIAPHVVDTVFLLFGIALLFNLALQPTQQPWLSTKFAGLIVYIGLGMIALRRGKSAQVRLVAFVGALSVYAYVIGVALSRSPASWIALFAG